MLVRRIRSSVYVRSFFRGVCFFVVCVVFVACIKFVVRIVCLLSSR